MDGQLVGIVAEASVPSLETRRLLPQLHRSTSAYSPKWSGAVGGAPIPGWWAADFIVPGNPLDVFSLDDAFYMPSWGAAFTRDGGLLSIASFATYSDPKLERMSLVWSGRASAPRMTKGVVTISLGAIHNFGHFVLDAMTAVFAIAGRDGEASFVTPPLRVWQRQYFELLNIRPIELLLPIYSFDRLSVSSGLRGSLHNPNLHFLALRDRMLQGLASVPDGPPLIYVSRRGQKRPMTNEAELEAALQALGFAIVRPEAMSVADQIKVFSGARVIVAPTGAALANLLYARGATVFEIIPRDMTLSDVAHKWVAFLTAMGGGDWRPYFCEDAPGFEQGEIAGEKKQGFIPFAAPIADLLSFIAPALH